MTDAAGVGPLLAITTLELGPLQEYQTHWSPSLSQQPIQMLFAGIVAPCAFHSPPPTYCVRVGRAEPPSSDGQRLSTRLRSLASEL